MSEPSLPAVAAELAELARRVRALEEQLAAAAPAPGRAPGGGTPVGTSAAPAACATGEASGVESASGAGASQDQLWALHGLQERLPGGTGAVLFTGSVPLTGGGTAVWQTGHLSADLLDLDAEDVAASLAALASPVRVRLLREVFAGRTSSGELAADAQFGTTGQVQHHLRQLVGAGWLRPTARGRYAVPPERVVPLLVAWAAASG